MTSWASIAKTTAQPAVAPQDLTASTQGLRLLVVDANAIIGGVRLEGIADRAVTIQEVYDEIRDKHSRQFLATLPYQLQVSEPTEESIKIVTRFARETGDVSTLSSNDIKLLALAYTLEVAAHGSTHLATHAAQPRMHSKPISSSGALPGWGSVPNPEDWKVVDEANEADEAAAVAASTSRISKQVQQLSLDPSQPNSFLVDKQPMQQPQQSDQPRQQPDAADGATQQQPAAAAQQAAVVVSVLEQPAHQHQAPPPLAAAAGAVGDNTVADDGWEVAASSAAAARRKKRKEHKRAEKQRAFEAEWEEHARIMQQQGEQQQQQNGVQADQQDGSMPAAADAADAEAEAEGESHSGSDSTQEEDDEVTNDELLAADHHIFTAEDDAETAAAGASSSQQQQDGLAPGMPGWQSSVASITADFAMQNVLLQMGLRLLTRDGRRIARLSRYALRCSACFTVTREPGRLFCPKCGNMTLDRVEVVVGPDGAEYFGIKKKHILRGTRYSLPKPRGGRNSKDPVLREDIFLLKVKALGRRAKKKAASDEDAASAAADPFAPEYSKDTWHVASQAELAQHRGLAAVLQPAWKNNPNERKLTRSNRRG